MNTLEITKEIRQVTFDYKTTSYEFAGTCNVSVENEVSNISTQVAVISNEKTFNIGNCSSNGSTNVNIYVQEYKDRIDVVASEFKALCAELITKYKNTTV